jgi:hypothetical protein
MTHNMSFETTHKMMSLDISDLYTNILIREDTDIIESNLERSTLN